MRTKQLLIQAGAIAAVALITAPAFAQVQDGGFEEGTPNPFWAEESLNDIPLICDASCGVDGANSGSNWAWMGGFIAGLEQATLTQAISVPDEEEVLLDFALNLDECSGNPNDRFRVEMGTTVVFEINAASEDCGEGYIDYSVDVTEFAGRDGNLILRSATQGTQITNFFVDDVTLGGDPVLFADGFEDETTDAWSSVKGDVVVTAGGLLDSAFKLEVPVNGDNVKHLVGTNDGGVQTSLSVEFAINVNEVDLGNKTVEVLRVFDQTPDDMIRVTVRQVSATSYKVKVLHRDDNGVLSTLGKTTVGTDAGTRFTLEWTASSADGANDGSIRLFRNDNMVAKIEVMGLDDDTKQSGLVRVGLPSGSSKSLGAGGTIYLDEVTISEL